MEHSERFLKTYKEKIVEIDKLKEEALDLLGNYFMWKLHEIRDKGEEKLHTQSLLIKEQRDLLRESNLL